MLNLVALQNYRENGEISSSLSLDATLAICHSESNWNGIRPEYAELERLHIDTYRRIHDDLEQIQLKMKEFEFKRWMGFCDKDVADLLKGYQAWANHHWNGSDPVYENWLRNFWTPQDAGELKLWEPYFARRDKIPLQKSMEEFNSWGSATPDKMKVSMGASAGRVLLTLRDRYAQDHPESIYGGAWISLIFDESALNPRGGTQGQCATKDEAIGLIQAVIDAMPKLEHNSDLRIG